MPKLVSGFVWFSKKPITRYHCYVTGVGVLVSNLSLCVCFGNFFGTCQIYNLKSDMGAHVTVYQAVIILGVDVSRMNA
jgi:hypothetical protein